MIVRSGLALRWLQGWQPAQWHWLVLAAYVAIVFGFLFAVYVVGTLYHDTRPPKQTTFAYCPCCLGDLCGNPKAWVIEHLNTTEFRCTCGRWSTWDFNAQVPILLQSARVAFKKGDSITFASSYVKPEYVGRVNDKGEWVHRAEG